MKIRLPALAVALSALLFCSASALAFSEAFKGSIYDPGPLKPVDSELKVREGEKAPDFTLPSLSGKPVSLSEYAGKKNVVISFVPAAWTPVCSDQWPGYNIARPLFERHNAVLLGITVDNLPTLHAWTRQMSGRLPGPETGMQSGPDSAPAGDLWFPVLSDFWPHGEVAARYGVLRTDGTAERALFVIDRKGVIRYIEVSDINRRPDLADLAGALEKLP